MLHLVVDGQSLSGGCDELQPLSDLCQRTARKARHSEGMKLKLIRETVAVVPGLFQKKIDKNIRVMTVSTREYVTPMFV